MKVIHDQFIGIYENAISDEWCDFTIKVMEDHAKAFQSRDQYWGDNAIDAKDLAVDLADIFTKGEDNRAQNIKEEFDKSLKKVYTLYQKRYLIAQPEFRIDHYKLQKTNPSEGYHVWHCEYPPYLEKELDDEKIFHLTTRFAAYTVYLNDVPEGGETEFLFQSKRVPAKKGTICLFPTSYTHLHRGNPPLLNTKYIMTGWLHINKEENE